jgi:hypothetical protein
MEATPWANYAFGVRKVARGNGNVWERLKRRVNAMVKVGVSGRDRMSFAPAMPEKGGSWKGLKMGGGKRSVILVGDIGGTRTPI